jgi:hypothetical protein
MFQNVAGVVHTTGISEDLIQTYIRLGWIVTVSKEGSLFLSFQQQYRLRFVHHLSTKMGLNEHEVATILRHENPPYSIASVPSILAEHCR